MARANSLTPAIIAENATNLFVKYGFGNTSMADIGKACGILKGSLYYHFESKEQILVYILETLSNTLTEHVFGVTEDAKLNSLEKLRHINSALEDYFLNKKGCLVAMMATESEIVGEHSKNIMKQIFTNWKQAYVNIYQQVLELKEAERIATENIVSIEGAIVWLRVTDDQKPLIDIFTTIENQLRATFPELQQ